MPRGSRPRATSVGGVLGLLGAALLLGGVTVDPPAAHAAVKERVQLATPEPGQVSIARLEFKVKGVVKPKIKVKAKNAGELSDSLIVAAQAARYENKKGRAVAFVAMANAAPSPSAVAATDTRGGPGQLGIEVRLTEARKATLRELGIKFDDDSGRSLNFLSPLGAEPLAERQLAQDVFDLGEGEFPDDEYGALDFLDALDIMKLHPFGQAILIHVANQAAVELTAYALIASSLAAALGPPAALHADVYSYTTGWPAPVKLQHSASPSPSNPSVVFTRIEWNTPVTGVQISQSSDNTVLHTADARCQNGLLQDGVVTWGPGPALGIPGMSYRLDCDLPQDTPRVFFDVSMAQPPSPGVEVFKVLPIPFHGGEPLGEAVAAEAASYLVRF